MTIQFAPMVESRDWEIIRSHVPLRWSEGTRGIVAANVEKNELVGAVVFQDWTRTSVQVHQWLSSPMLIRAGIFNEVCDYAFNETGRSQLIGLVPGDQEKVIRFNEKLGFKVAYRLPDGWDVGIDQVVMIGTRDDLSRWWTPRELAA